MSTLFYKALIARMQTYPRQVHDVETLYAKAAALVEKFELDAHGDVVTETEMFREKLREYDVAMLACERRAQDLATDIQSDMVSAEEYDKSRGENLSLSDQVEILTSEYSRLRVVQHACREHRKLAERGRRMLPMAQEQRSLRRLRLLIGEMQVLDEVK